MTISSVAGKSADAFRTISEVAESLRLPQHVLRFWETRFTQIKPLKRAGGRRFYRPEDVELLGAIRQLLYGEGYTIKGVQRILREQGPRAVAALARGQGQAVQGEAVPLAASSIDGDDEGGAGADANIEGAGEAPDAAASADAVDAPPAAPLNTHTRSVKLPPLPWEVDPAPAPPVASPFSPAQRTDCVEDLRAALAEIEHCRRLIEDGRR